MNIKTLATALVPVLTIISPVWAGGGDRHGFDWDRYDAQQYACTVKDRIVMDCARGYCDNQALQQAQRDCSAFGPLDPFRPLRDRDARR